jgi:hypothetical protein
MTTAKKSTSKQRANAKSPQPPGSERARDEQREGGGPRYGGREWQTADERAPDERFGRTRADAADVTEDGRPRDLGALTSDEADAAEDADGAPETNGPTEGVHRGNITRGED